MCTNTAAFVIHVSGPQWLHGAREHGSRSREGGRVSDIHRGGGLGTAHACTSFSLLRHLQSIVRGGSMWQSGSQRPGQWQRTFWPSHSVALTPLSLSVRRGIMANWSSEVCQSSDPGWRNHKSLFSACPPTLDWPLQELFTLSSHRWAEYSLSYVSFSVWASVYVCTVGK